MEVNGERATLGVGTYNLPDTVGGVQIDSPVVEAYIVDVTSNCWVLESDARLRLWAGGSSWIRPSRAPSGRPALSLIDRIREILETK